jgi:phage FluMu protein gp41
VSLLPVPLDDDTGLTSRQATKAKRAQAGAELELFRYGLRARTRSEKDQLDSQAAADALGVALDEELRLLREGLAQAGQSAAGVELVARKVELLANIDNRRIARRFGG